MSRTVASAKFQSAVSGGSRSRGPRTALIMSSGNEQHDFRVLIAQCFETLLRFSQILPFVTDIVFGIQQDHFLILRFEVAAELYWRPHPKRIGFDHCIFRNQSSSSDDRARPNARAV